MKPKVLLIIPAYNEEENLENVVNNVITNYPEYDYVVVNDGSQDDTRKICIQNNYNFLDYPVNQGLTSSFRGGLYYAIMMNYDYVIQCDADGQHDPIFIDSMLKTAISKNIDIVIGSRFVNKKKNFSFRMLGSRVISFCIYITTHRIIKDPTSGMRLFNRKSMELMYKQKEFGPEPDTISHLLKSGLTIEELPIEIGKREGGKSYFNISNSINYMIHMCFSIVLVDYLRRRK